MSVLIAGLVIFLGIHSVAIVAPGWRNAQFDRLGEKAWKGIYSIVSLIGFVLLVWGYGLSRQAGIELWQPPSWTRHLAGVLMLLSFVLLAAAYVPGTRIKSVLHHPMVLGVMVWAFAHLIANGRLGDVLIFGAFLVWAVLDFRSARARDRAAGVVYKPGSAGRDVIAVAVGLVAWAGFSFALHGWLIGVQPFG